MKPLTLTLTGLRSYPNPVTVDFTGRTLVAALGDTGAGKSSLLEAITFALFNKNSWDAKETRQLIADHAQAMSVELTFLHDGQRWHIHRTTHATNQNAGRHHLKNLDTGEEIDGAIAIETRIKSMLQMSYQTFLRVALLPQGKFDQLLTTTPGKRNERLGELFGAQSLKAVHAMADRRSRTLQELIGEARTKRAPMPDHPAQTAAEAVAKADAAAARADRLTTAADRITELNNQASAARATAAAATAAADNLAARAVNNATSHLDVLEPLATAITERRSALDQRTIQTRILEDELTEAITAATAKGENRDALTKAATILETLATHAEEHRNKRDQLAARTTQLDDEGNAITTAEADLTDRTDHAAPLAQAAKAAAQASTQIRTHAATARSRATAAISAAHRIAKAANAQTTAEEEREFLRKQVGGLEKQTAADEEVTHAEARLEELQLRHRAATIAAELHPGSDCPVCRQPTPDDFEPALTSDAADLNAAKKHLRTARALHQKAIQRLADARAALAAAEKTVAERTTEHQNAQQNTQQAVADAERVFNELQVLTTASPGPGPGFDATSMAAVLTQTVQILATPAVDGATHTEQDSERRTAPITGALTACEQAAAEHAEQRHAEALSATTTIEADRKALQGHQHRHQRDLAAHAAATKQHEQALARTEAQLRALPTRIQALLPNRAIDVIAKDTSAALDATAASLARLQELLDAKETARAEAAVVLAEHRTLDQENRSQVERPLDRLNANLDAWAQAAHQAVAHLGSADRHHVPPTPHQTSIAEARQFALDLSTVTSTLIHTLTELSTNATSRAADAMTSLHQHAALLADIDDFDPTADLTTPQALHPLVAAAARATKEAEDQRTKQREAHALIQPAADLDFAIAAGTARHQALEVLRRELVDAKFLGHLTMLRTRALLGAASDLLGDMSDGRFGFADDFNIVSRGSGVVHHPNRLSGGEKFLASLALALALAELHSRSGPTLGSLFLDEGFAALDTTALDSALEALRAQAGGDRLVMVISHLHAVAEAVDNVLWVERTNAGSSARWLTPAERTELVQDDLANGLQILAR
ncbi:AAA family ATPase [Kitasatospora sp. NPDC059571]|uniref:AAA family ATPase n=1 Tax=Kitasatospora sp. NPDC059571 TaxID=3346871 RepID=UPI00368707DC